MRNLFKKKTVAQASQVTLTIPTWQVNDIAVRAAEETMAAAARHPATRPQPLTMLDVQRQRSAPYRPFSAPYTGGRWTTRDFSCSGGRADFMRLYRGVGESQAAYEERLRYAASDAQSENDYLQQVASRANKAFNAEARRAISAESLLREVNDKNKNLTEQLQQARDTRSGLMQDAGRRAAAAEAALADVSQCLEETLLRVADKDLDIDVLKIQLGVQRNHTKMYRDERNLERKEVDRLKRVVGRLEEERDHVLGQVRWYERKFPLSASGTRAARADFLRDPYTGQPMSVENMGTATVPPLPVTIEPPPGLRVTWGAPLLIALKSGETLKLRMEISPAIGG